MNLLVTILLVLLGLEYSILGIGTDGLNRLDGTILLILFIAYMWICFKSGKDDKKDPETGRKTQKLWVSILMIMAGLAALVIGGNLFVDNATGIASKLGISDKFIAITILAGGTSLPELATCVAAAVKKKGQLALGNIIGSNLFNILLILGTSAVIAPISFRGINFIDMGALLVSAIALVTCLFVGKKNQLDRLDGSLFLLIWAAYMAYLIVNL